jgi:hypothetical protein
VEPALPVPDELPLIELPVAEPEVDEPVFEVEEPLLDAVFNRGCPVVLSRQCVAADTLPVVDGEEEDDED